MMEAETSDILAESADEATPADRSTGPRPPA
jgi:hypothetical protein